MCSHNNVVLSTATFDHVVVSQATVATAASANPSTVNGTSTTLSVLGADPAGESNLTYTWAATTVPTGGSASYGGFPNGSNGAKNITATFNEAGTYTFTVTISDGLVSTTSAVNVTVNQSVTSIAVTPASPSVTAGTTQQFSASANDQFGFLVSPAPTFTWTTTGAGNTITAAGLLAPTPRPATTP